MINDDLARKMAAGTAWGRVGFGSMILLAPAITLRLFGIREIPGPMRWLGRVLGVRDVVLGAGTLVSLRKGNNQATALWVAMGAAADGADTVLAISRPAELGKKIAPVAALFSASAAIPGALAAWRLGRSRSALDG